MTRVFGLKVPSTISPDFRCRLSTTFFVRKHLPKGKLCSPVLPLIVNKRQPYLVMPLPSRYWPKRFVDWWSDWGG